MQLFKLLIRQGVDLLEDLEVEVQRAKHQYDPALARMSEAEFVVEFKHLATIIEMVLFTCITYILFCRGHNLVVVTFDLAHAVLHVTKQHERVLALHIIFLVSDILKNIVSV